MTDLKNKTLLVYDNGWFIELARKLAEDFGKVMYFCPWKSGFPKSKDYQPGCGLEEVEKVKHFYRALKKADMVLFPDVYDFDLQEHLRELEIPVWGVGAAEEMELDRMRFRSFQEENDYPRPRTRRIVGMDKLQELTEKEKDIWIKTSGFRGDFETFHHEKPFITESWLDERRRDLGKRASIHEFIIEDPLPNMVEPGYDGLTVDGKLPLTAAWGFEVKDMGYIGKADKYANFPGVLVEANEQLVKVFEKAGSRGFFSTEVRVGKSRKPVILDPCMRCASPPTEGLMELYSNLGEIVWEGANGKLVEPKPVAKYLAVLMMTSAWAETHWMPIDFPKEARRWVKMRDLTMIEGKHYVVPHHFNYCHIGAVIGLGSTIDEAINKASDVAKEVQGLELEIALKAGDDAKEVVKQALQYGLRM
jgi:hypothetical protein